MTFLFPVPLSESVEPDQWSSYVKHHIERYFHSFCTKEQFNSVCLMLLPSTEELPMVAIEDTYDDAESLMEQVAHAVHSLPAPKQLRPNTDGQIVVAWPFIAADQNHRHMIMSLLQEVATLTRASASAVIHECWLRTDLNAPSGTGEDNLLALIEREGHDTQVSIAKIVEKDEQGRALQDWVDLAGTVRNQYTSILKEKKEPRINVPTVGEA